MKYFKKTFIWIIVLTVLGGYYYIDVKKEQIREKQKDEATRLFPFSPNQVLKIHLQKEGSNIALERWEEGWRLVEPVTAPAVGEEVEKFLKLVADSRNDSDYVMDPDPTEDRLKEFGLDRPEVTVSLFVGMGLVPHTLHFGNRAPTKGVAFARLQGDPKVYRVLADAKAEADQDVYYFRDKKVVDFDPSQVDKVEITSPGGPLHCELPMDGKWRITAPVNVKADITKVMEFLTAFKNSEIQEFIEEEPQDLEKYGLSSGRYELAFRVSGEKEPSRRIFMGERDKKKRGVYATIGGAKNVVLLEDKLLDYIPSDPFTLMDKEIFSFTEEEVQKIQIEANGAGWEFEKAPDYTWKRTRPTEAPMDFQPLMAFLQEIRSASIQKFLPGNPALFKTSGLSKPVYKVIIWKKGTGAEEWLALGNKVKEEGYYAMSGSGGDIYVVGLAVAENIQNFVTIHRRGAESAKGDKKNQ